jgi:hypothetical protein
MNGWKSKLHAIAIVSRRHQDQAADRTPVLLQKGAAGKILARQ